jgi:hypothetical protein
MRRIRHKDWKSTRSEFEVDPPIAPETVLQKLADFTNERPHLAD